MVPGLSHARERTAEESPDSELFEKKWILAGLIQREAMQLLRRKEATRRPLPRPTRAEPGPGERLGEPSTVLQVY